MAGPVRTCVGCRSRRPAAELVRIARLDDGRLAVDRTAPGRGAWVCAAGFGRPAADCIDAAVRRGGFARAFRVPVPGGGAELRRATAPERETMEDGAANGAARGRD
ncbi:MAG: YlxR family protein [Actinomycetota bacterium]|nr:YlxR family protein [Actinomycetota bacterium]